MAGKGDKRRPMNISYKEWCENWDQVFIDKKYDSTTETNNDIFEEKEFDRKLFTD